MWIYILLDCLQKCEWHISSGMDRSSQYKISIEESPYQGVSSDLIIFIEISS